ncbi:MAG: 5-oxoprolinase subunit PxpB [Cyclobacteriaceae bacterium]|nr:5-oxoprolinase subunit PxpB [Cyclobacteriaceae bacterium]
MNSYPLIYKAFGESTLLIEWPGEIDQAILVDVLQFQSSIENELCDVLIETVNAYNSLTVIFQSDIISFKEIKEKTQRLYQLKFLLIERKRNTWKIPVCYDKEFGIDLDDVANQNKRSVEEIIAIHCMAEYTVYFTGFLPGFLYLGGLPKPIHTPRKSTPRLRIKKGAVAIGGQQTGVYPSESPGGWNIIGNSPLLFFDPKLTPPCFARAGDLLQFYPIDKKEHQKILREVELGIFKIESKSE